MTGPRGILEEFSSRPSSQFPESREKDWKGPNAPGLVDVLTEAGDRDECQEFLATAQSPPDSKTGEQQRKNKDAVIKLIRIKHEELKEVERRLDEALDRERENPKGPRDNSDDEINDLKEDSRRRRDHIRSLESFLEDLISREAKKSGTSRSDKP